MITYNGKPFNIKVYMKSKDFNSSLVEDKLRMMQKVPFLKKGKPKTKIIGYFIQGEIK